MHRWTWYSIGASKTIEHVLVGRRWRPVTDCSVFRSDELVGTDQNASDAVNVKNVDAPVSCDSPTRRKLGGQMKCGIPCGRCGIYAEMLNVVGVDNIIRYFDNIIRHSTKSTAHDYDVIINAIHHHIYNICCALLRRHRRFEIIKLETICAAIDLAFSSHLRYVQFSALKL